MNVTGQNLSDVWKTGRAVVPGAILVLLLAAGCQPERPRGTRQQTQSAQTPWTVERREIPLDEAAELQEASLRRNIYFIFDGSGSMRDGPDRGCRGDQRFPTKLDGAKWAVQEFLGKVPDDINIGLYVFASGGRRELVPLGAGNRQEFIAAVEQIQAGGGTPLADSIRFGTDQLVQEYKKQLGYGEFRLVVVTDGKAQGIPAAATYAASYGIPIYAIGLCIDEDHPLRQFAVAYRAADSFEDLAQGLEETLAELPAFDAQQFEPE